MEQTKLIVDEFNNFYDEGLKFLDLNNGEAAVNSFYKAANCMLKIAKISNDESKKKYLNKANNILSLIVKIDPNSKLSSKNQLVSEEQLNSSCEIKYPNETIDEAINELNKLEGLKSVKQTISDLINQVRVNKLRKKQGLPICDMSYHMVFTGNPGTGKTTVARIIGKIYHALGLLSKGHYIECDRSDLVAGYCGQTATKTRDLINSAKGGVLFIDEAYTLVQDDRDSFGQEARDKLNKDIEDNRNDLVVILAGYKDEIEKFINSNQGLKSRFRTYINFDDYNGDELFKIFISLVSEYKYKLTKEARNSIYQYLNNSRINKFTANARDVRNLYENIISLLNRRVGKIINPTQDDLITITEYDLPFNNAPSNDINKNSIIKSSKAIDAIDKDYKIINNDGLKFNWDNLPNVSFDDIVGLDEVKEIVNAKVLLPLKYPHMFDGYNSKNGGGLFLYGPPGTGKTMIGAAIAKEIGAKFCSVKPSDLLNQGVGNTEKAIKQLFFEARKFPCSVIYFDEMDSLAPKNTRSSVTRQLRSEFLAQIQGIESYNVKNDNILFLICATNKPWDVDSAFIRPGRFGTRAYVGLPSDEARREIISMHLNKIKNNGLVTIDNDIQLDSIVQRTNGYNCADITSLLERVDEISAIRAIRNNIKIINMEDFESALKEIKSSVQFDDIKKLKEWRNDDIK